MTIEQWSNELIQSTIKWKNYYKKIQPGQMTFWFWTETKKGVTDFDTKPITSDYKQLPSLFIYHSTKETKEKGKEKEKKWYRSPTVKLNKIS